jgi:uncharacterized protein YjiS (DUF1127 family)
MNLLTNLARSWAQYRTFRATLAELQMCSDRQLADMGFVRGDLARIAYEAAERATEAGVPGPSAQRATQPTRSARLTFTQAVPSEAYK